MNRRKLLVRKRGFEPLRSCDRQPLKLVRLPVPPLPREGRNFVRAYFGCAGGVDGGRAGVVGALPGVVGALAGAEFRFVGAGAGVGGRLAGAGVPLTIDPGPR